MTPIVWQTVAGNLSRSFTPCKARVSPNSKYAMPSYRTTPAHFVLSTNGLFCTRIGLSFGSDNGSAI